MDYFSPAARFWVFLAALGLLLILEFQWPRRAVRFGPWRRVGNLGLGMVGACLSWLLAPLAMLSVAAFGAAHELGVLPQLERYVDLSPWTTGVVTGVVTGVLGFVLLDLAVYVQHRLMHRLGPLWRFHRVHHTDPELDVTSGVRFHPVEVLLSLLLKSAVVLLVGLSFASVLAFEITLSVASLLTHANFRLPARLEPVLRRFIVTPDMHLVHHSTLRAEHDRNFGTVLSLWDRLFGTYLAAAGEGMRVGLTRPAVRYSIALHWLLAQPWLRRSPGTNAAWATCRKER